MMVMLVYDGYDSICSKKKRHISEISSERHVTVVDIVAAREMHWLEPLHRLENTKAAYVKRGFIGPWGPWPIYRCIILMLMIVNVYELMFTIPASLS